MLTDEVELGEERGHTPFWLRLNEVRRSSMRELMMWRLTRRPTEQVKTNNELPLVFRTLWRHIGPSADKKPVIGWDGAGNEPSVLQLSTKKPTFVGQKIYVFYLQA